MWQNLWLLFVLFLAKVGALYSGHESMQMTEEPVCSKNNFENSTDNFQLF